MNKILVTGANGSLGKKTFSHLLKRVSANELVGLAREPEKAQDLVKLGIEIRQGDYMDKQSLIEAMRGIERVMFIGTPGLFPDRITAHSNVIDAAVTSGVKHLVFMPIMRKTDYKVTNVSNEDEFTENKLKSSGLNYTIVYHPPFLEYIPAFIGFTPWDSGIVVPAGKGKVAVASQEDLAEAHAVILTEKGHENKSYVLNGNLALSFEEMAEALSKISGKNVPYKIISREDYVNTVVPHRLPQAAAQFVDEWVQGVNLGEFDVQTNDLEKLIGHRPKSIIEFFKEEFHKAKN